MASPSALLVHPHPKCKFALSVLPSPPPLEMSRRDSHGLSHAPKSGRGFPLPAVKLVEPENSPYDSILFKEIGHWTSWPFRHLFSRRNLLRLSRLGVGRCSGGTSFILIGWFWHQFPRMLSTESGPSDVSFPTCVGPSSTENFNPQLCLLHGLNVNEIVCLTMHLDLREPLGFFCSSNVYFTIETTPKN